VTANAKFHLSSGISIDIVEKYEKEFIEIPLPRKANKLDASNYTGVPKLSWNWKGTDNYQILRPLARVRGSLVAVLE